jgi:hypothetical protein
VGVGALSLASLDGWVGLGRVDRSGRAREVEEEVPFERRRLHLF